MKVTSRSQMDVETSNKEVQPNHQTANMFNKMFGSKALSSAPSDGPMAALPTGPNNSLRGSLVETNHQLLRS